MHINKRNKRLYREYKNLVNLYDESGKIFLTGIKDIDYQILYNLDNVNDLSKVCRINKYTQELCDKNFWIAKFKNENLDFIIDPGQLELKEWLLLYRNTKIAKENAKYALTIYNMKYSDDSIKIKVKQNKKLLQFIYSYIKNDEMDNIRKIKIRKNENDYDLVLFIEDEYIDDIKFDQDEVLKLLYLSYVYSYPLSDILKVTCKKIPLIIDDHYLQDYDFTLDDISDEEDLDIIKKRYTRYGMLEALKKSM